MALPVFKLSLHTNFSSHPINFSQHHHPSIFYPLTGVLSVILLGHTAPPRYPASFEPHRLRMTYLHVPGDCGPHSALDTVSP